ncbi:uncharacterized protein E5676_scaffold863G00210, partial [Aduncisulcus paluster]
MHIPNFSSRAHKLYDLLSKQRSFSFTQEHQRIFDDLRDSIQPDNPLTFFDQSKPHFLYCDASDWGVGGVLFQEDKPVMFISKKLTETQRNWSVLEKEAFAIFHCLKATEFLLA